MAIILDDITHRSAFYPFTNICTLADIRMGVFTFSERWSKLTNDSIYVSSETEHDESYKYHEKFAANVLPTDSRWNDGRLMEVVSPWEIILKNTIAIELDFKLITENRYSNPLSNTNNILNASSVFAEKGVKAEFVTFNATEGPIYIGKNAEIMEGSIIRGPVAICEGAIIKMGSRIYGGTTIGPYCVAGGEIKNSILSGFSNKSHDGYLGDSIIGQWCNLGAGTSNSNVKNTAGVIKVWNNEKMDFVSGSKKCGLLMGDYSKCAINTSFNTGTTVGTCCNIFGNGFPSKHVKNFSWGEKDIYTLEKAIDDINNWKQMKGKYITEKEKSSLKKIYTN